MKRIKKSKALPVTGREGSQGCERSRFPHFLDNWLTDGGKGVSLMHRLAALYTPVTILVLISVKRPSRPYGHIVAGRIM
jgi:hypothetical protein